MKLATRFLLLLLVSWPVSGALAQPALHIEELSKLDLGFMTQHRALLEEMAAFNLGRRFSGDRDRDLDLLQTLLEKRLVGPDQTPELQAMGIVMGDLLASEFSLHWVVYKDNAGRSRALRYGDSDFFLFPVTMVSRRREAGDETPIATIYRKASDIIATNTPAPPFQ